jgi:cell division protein FtsB
MASERGSGAGKGGKRSRSGSLADSPAARLAKRVVWMCVIGAAIVFAIQGGQYSTLDLFRQSRQQKQLTRAVDSLSRLVDSLRTYEHRLEHDPALQERIAREQFGMVRGNKELLYRFTDPPADTAK